MLERETTQSKFIDMLAFEIGMATYIFGFPLVLMDVTRAVFSNNLPINHLEHTRAFPNEACLELVRPNVDTLYSSGFLDLSLGPVVLSIPDVGDRYYLVQLMDAWTNIFSSLGTRTTGNKKEMFVINGPGWMTNLPDRIPVIQSPTSLVWICARTQTNNPEDYPAVHTIQDQFRLMPLRPPGHPPSAMNSMADPTISAATATPIQHVTNMYPLSFLNRMTTLMGSNPPSLADDQIIRGLTSLGISPDKPIKLARMKKAVVQGIAAGCRAGLETISNEAKNLHGRIVNGWQFSGDMGRYETRYLGRAAIATFGFGATLPEDLVCARAAFDESGEALRGSNHYVINFRTGEWPPVNAFWTLTMYDEQQHFVANPLGRFAISSRDQLKVNYDGSLSLYIQHARPGRDMESNWLPAPRANFSILLRLYWPKAAILNGSWRPPQIALASAQAKASA